MVCKWEVECRLFGGEWREGVRRGSVEWGGDGRQWEKSGTKGNG